jgi:hypothetical protein
VHPSVRENTAILNHSKKMLEKAAFVFNVTLSGLANWGKNVLDAKTLSEWKESFFGWFILKLTHCEDNTDLHETL